MVWAINQQAIVNVAASAAFRMVMRTNAPPSTKKRFAL
jgi:hypothetical protein